MFSSFCLKRLWNFKKWVEIFIILLLWFFCICCGFHDSSQECWFCLQQKCQWKFSWPTLLFHKPLSLSRWLTYIEIRLIWNGSVFLLILALGMALISNCHHNKIITNFSDDKNNACYLYNAWKMLTINRKLLKSCL